MCQWTEGFARAIQYNGLRLACAVARIRIRLAAVETRSGRGSVKAPADKLGYRVRNKKPREATYPYHHFHATSGDNHSIHGRYAQYYNGRTLWRAASCSATWALVSNAMLRFFGIPANASETGRPVVVDLSTPR